MACQNGFCGRDCTATTENNPQIESSLPNGDIVCTDRRLDPAVSCSDCLYNLDVFTNCSICLEPSFDPDTNCTAPSPTLSMALVGGIAGGVVAVSVIAILVLIVAILLVVYLKRRSTVDVRVARGKYIYSACM